MKQVKQEKIDEFLPPKQKSKPIIKPENDENQESEGVR